MYIILLIILFKYYILREQNSISISIFILFHTVSGFYICLPPTLFSLFFPLSSFPIFLTFFNFIPHFHTSQFFISYCFLIFSNFIFLTYTILTTFPNSFPLSHVLYSISPIFSFHFPSLVPFFIPPQIEIFNFRFHFTFQPFFPRSPFVIFLISKICSSTAWFSSCDSFSRFSLLFRVLRSISIFCGHFQFFSPWLSGSECLKFLIVQRIML